MIDGSITKSHVHQIAQEINSASFESVLSRKSNIEALEKMVKSPRCFSDDEARMYAEELIRTIKDN